MHEVPCIANSLLLDYIYGMHPDPETSITDVVRSLRFRAGISQAELARRVGTTQSAISRWENGHEEPRWSTLQQLAEACELRCTIAVDEDVDRAQLRAHLAMSPADRLRAVANVSRLRSLASATTSSTDDHTASQRTVSR